MKLFEFLHGGTHNERAERAVRAYSTSQLGVEFQLHMLHDDCYVGELDIMVDEGGRFRTWTTWQQGVRTLLPRADMVGMGLADGSSIVRLWKDVVSVCPELSKPSRRFPGRYGPAQWDDPDIWLKLKAIEKGPDWLPRFVSGPSDRLGPRGHKGLM